MQAAAQKWVDSSISKTINVPEDIGFEAFKDVYMQAYETGCKGCTTYRPNDVTGQVLSVSERESDRAPRRGPEPKPGRPLTASGATWSTCPNR
jgi:ribonucleoside-diphosphate reductase alpha chain